MVLLDREEVSHHDRQLLIDSRCYASETRWKSWWHLLSTLAVLFTLILIVGCFASLVMRLACSVIIALTLIRMFIFYHDFLHQTIFRGSLVAALILRTYGLLMLTPASVWKRSHDHHHRNNAKFFGATIGSFPVMTKLGYQNATPIQRLEYRIARSPLIIVFGYFTVFLFGMCFYPLLTDFRRNISAAAALVVHFGTIAMAINLAGWSFTAFAFLIPTILAMLMGAYLFYVQHNFPGARIPSTDRWNHSDAALSASSYLKTGAIMRWFTGNIGFHHVHHLNAKIPFYRLPEAMAGLDGLQKPGVTSLSIRDIIGCMRLKLWDTDTRRFVSFAAVGSNA